MKGLLVLAGAAIAVGLGVMAIAGLILPDGANPATPEAAPENRAETAEVDTPTTLASLPWPPENIGGLVEVSGDRPGTIEFDERQNAFATDSRFELASSESSMLFGEEDGTLFVDQLTYDGLNLFLDPGDCEFAEQDRTEELGLVRLGIACAEISDVQGNNTVTMEGAIDVPLLIGVASEYDSGGTLRLSGDIDADITVPEALWYDYPEDMYCPLASCTPGQFQDSFFVSTFTESADPDDPGLVVEFDLEESPPRLARLSYQPEIEGDVGYEFTVQAGDCTDEETNVARIAPDTQLLEIALDCPELTGADGEVVSMAGVLRVHKIIPSNPFHQ